MSMFILLLRVTPVGWSHVESSRGMKVYGGSERTEGLSQEETASKAWFTLLMMIILTACRYLKRCIHFFNKVYSWESVCFKRAMIAEKNVLHQMRTTQRVSVWPVGLVGGMKYERPVVEEGKVGAHGGVCVLHHICSRRSLVSFIWIRIILWLHYHSTQCCVYISDYSFEGDSLPYWLAA